LIGQSVGETYKKIKTFEILKHKASRGTREQGSKEAIVE